MPLPIGVRVAGNPGPIRIQLEQRDSAFSPSEQSAHYRGEKNATFAAYLAISRRASRARLSQDGASATIDVSYKNEAVFVDTIEIDFNAVQREWWTAPAYVTLTNSELFAIAGRLKALEEYAADATNTPTEIDLKRIEYVLELGGVGLGLAGQAFDDIIANGETYTALLPVVTFTRIASQYEGTQFVMSNVGMLFSTAQLLSVLPVNLQITVEEVTNTVAANSRQTLAWLKTGRYGVASDGNVHFVQQYVFDAYATARYNFVA